MLKELIISNPKESIIFISIVVTLLMTLATKYLTNQEEMKKLKEEQKKHQEKMKQNKDNVQEMQKIQKEMLASSMALMKHSFKPMLITFAPLLLFFWWMRKILALTAFATSWIWWYIGASIISSILFRKIFKVV